jgi:hypothetical protein
MELLYPAAAPHPALRATLSRFAGEGFQLAIYSPPLMSIEVPLITRE